MKLAALTVTALLLSTTAQANTCPDYTSAANPPSFSNPAKKSFRSFGNKILAGIYKPQHMIHDAIVKQGNTATLIGKFDYDPVLHKDLEKEYVHTYISGTGMNGWQYLGRFTTDSDGKIQVAINKSVGEYRIRMVVEGDLSSADGFLSVVNPGQEAVLFDIDGTLTLNDFEAAADYLGIKTAQTYNYATQTVNAYKAKGYQIIYLTARPYWVTSDARGWFPSVGLQAWHYHSNPFGDGPIPNNTQAFKADYVKYLRNTVGLNIIRAYGNATTDIGAYAEAGIPKADTWIVGQYAGTSGTQAIQGDYSYHYSTLVTSTRNASCKSQ